MIGYENINQGSLRRRKCLVPKQKQAMAMVRIAAISQPRSADVNSRTPVVTVRMATMSPLDVANAGDG